MEPQCEFVMYFPAAPIPTLSDPAQCASLPRRQHVYLGETVEFLLLLRCSAGGGAAGSPSPWGDTAGSLCALASACVAEDRRRRPGESEPDVQSYSSGSSEGDGGGADSSPSFTQCDPIVTHSSPGRDGRQGGGEPVKSTVVLDDQVVFSLSVSFDKLPPHTLKAKVVVTVWKQDEEKPEVREHGYRTLLQLRRPGHTFRQDLNLFRTQVSTTLRVLPPPSIRCQQLRVSGKHMTVLKVLNSSSQDSVCVTDVKIVPNLNSSYLPMMPDGSVLIVDTVCHQSAELTAASFCRVGGGSCSLGALEEHNFLFRLHLQNKADGDSSQGLEIPLVAVLQWHAGEPPYTKCISSCYLLPSVRLDRPQLVMTASCPRVVRPLQRFWVTYTLLNELRDFLSVRLSWTPEAPRGGQQSPVSGSVVCQSPVNNLGQCVKGSTLSFSVAFQILRTGLFELSQHMKLKLQFTASLSDTHTLGRSHSFTHRQTPRPQHVRSGSVMDYRTAAPPAGPALGRASAPPPDHSLILLDKIAKRECQVLVLEAGDVGEELRVQDVPPRFV